MKVSWSLTETGYARHAILGGFVKGKESICGIPVRRLLYAAKSPIDENGNISACCQRCGGVLFAYADLQEHLRPSEWPTLHNRLGLFLVAMKSKRGRPAQVTA